MSARLIAMTFAEELSLYFSIAACVVSFSSPAITALRKRSCDPVSWAAIGEELVGNSAPELEGCSHSSEKLVTKPSLTKKVLTKNALTSAKSVCQRGKDSCASAAIQNRTH